jgi:hypothetical protein
MTIDGGGGMAGTTEFLKFLVALQRTKGRRA